MRILHLAAGAGPMYCGACARDLALARGLIGRGHDFQIIPLYTPLKTEGDDPFPTQPVFLGGINAYLQQYSGLFRRLPPFLDRILDSPALLRWASRFALSTEAADLGATTVSVLAGREGNQVKEFARLLDYLLSQDRPHLFSITNTLLSGVAPELKARFGLPITCGLQGEDGFVRSMTEPHRTQAQDLMRRNARAIDLFIAPTHAYAQEMADYLALPAEKVKVVHTGLEVDPYRRIAMGRSARLADAPFTLGYLSSITPGKGLDLLVEALRVLLRDAGRDVRLRVAGLVLDAGYWRSLQASVKRSGLADRIEYLGEVGLEGKLGLLSGVDAFSVPSRFSEARGVAVMEALAAGVPVVVPNAGAYPELLALCGGGTLFPPGDAAALASQLAQVMDDPAGAHQRAQAGSEALATLYSHERTAAEYEKALEPLLPT
ncbi:MAG: glycosyltransferase family 4 protein [Armatimonadia bacterium]